MKQASLLFCLLCFVGLTQTTNATALPTSYEVTGDGGEGDKKTVTLFEAQVVTKQFKDILNIDIRTQSEQVINVEIFNESGEVVFNDKLSLYGVMLKKIYTDEYPSGKYKVLITCEDQQLIEEIEKK